MRTVELKTAFHWHCDDCSAENFSLPQKAEMTDEEAEAAYREFHELDRWQSLPPGWRCFEMVQRPDWVRCSQCGNAFATKDEESC